MEGETKDVAREFLGRHEANVVDIKECGEIILLLIAVHQVLMTLWQFNIRLGTQDSNPRWTQGDEACKIEVQLDSHKLDLSQLRSNLRKFDITSGNLKLHNDTIM